MTLSKAARARRTCERKLRHESEGAAIKARRTMGARGEGLLVYKCSACSGWHLGNQTDPKG